MAWYKLSATHGPGHQSSTHEYRFSKRRLTEGDRGRWWNSWVDSRYMRDPRGDVDLIQPSDIPNEERSEMIKDARERMKEDKLIIESLENL